MVTNQLQRLKRYWDRQSTKYDRKMLRAERHFFGDTRSWIAGQARGETLEVAVGTGLNLPWYPENTTVTGIDISPRMLELALQRARCHDIQVSLAVGNAQQLDFQDECFDTVISTFSMCSVPDDAQALSEMVRVLRPGGVLLLADHVEADPWWLRTAQATVDLISVPIRGEHFRRRPIRHLSGTDIHIERHERFHRGLIERLAARK